MRLQLAARRQYQGRHDEEAPVTEHWSPPVRLFHRSGSAGIDLYPLRSAAYLPDRCEAKCDLPAAFARPGVVYVPTAPQVHFHRKAFASPVFDSRLTLWATIPPYASRKSTRGKMKPIPPWHGSGARCVWRCTVVGLFARRTAGGVGPPDGVDGVRVWHVSSFLAGAVLVADRIGCVSGCTERVVFDARVLVLLGEPVGEQTRLQSPWFRFEHGELGVVAWD